MVVHPAFSVIVKEMDDVEFDRVRFLENLARKDLSDMEIARVLRYMLEKYKEEYPTQEVLAKAFGKSRTWVTHHLSMLDLEKFWTEKLSNVTRVTFAEIIDMVTERQVREILSVPLEKRDELALWIAEKLEETGEIPSAREIREFVRPAEAVPEAVSEAPEISEGEEEPFLELLLDHLRVRGVEQVFIHACLSFSAMLTVALTAIKRHKPNLIRSIKHYTTQ